MNATMTHDAKHAEDFRARLNVLSEIPEEWSDSVRRWSAWNSEKRTQGKHGQVPESNEEMLIYQALLGSWPNCHCARENYVQRLQDFVVKAGREAMVHTRWTIPNVEHEKALTDFVAAILDPSRGNLFLNHFREFASRISFHGALNGLSQLLIKIDSPGVPDFYQGSELWDLRLVDPDNRQPVDFDVRTRQLGELSDAANSLPELLSNWSNGAVKLFVAQKALACRRQQAQLFLRGKYLPLEVTGSQAESIFAFARHYRRAWSVVIAPRLTTRVTSPQVMPLGEAWSETSILLPENCPILWRDIFTSHEYRAEDDTKTRSIPVGSALRDFPVAMLTARQ